MHNSHPRHLHMLQINSVIPVIFRFYFQLNLEHNPLQKALKLCGSTRVSWLKSLAFKHCEVGDEKYISSMSLKKTMLVLITKRDLSVLGEAPHQSAI